MQGVQIQSDEDRRYGAARSPHNPIGWAEAYIYGFNV